MTDFSGKTAIVAGATAGIGLSPRAGGGRTAA